MDVSCHSFIRMARLAAPLMKDGGSLLTLTYYGAERVIPHMPKSVLKVAESGIKTVEDAARMRAAGAHALLVGESLMREQNPTALMKALQNA